MQKAITAIDLKNFVLSSMVSLELEAQEIDALNVFPVPDGDTGTNMLLTMQSVMAELDGCKQATLSVYTKAIKDGSLKGARGNSGVILSQILRGICDVFGELEEIKGEDLAKALSRGARVAYEAVMKPVEGTMLTVIKDMAREARKAARQTDNTTEIIERVLNEGKASVLRTPDLLDILKKAGVVDAGGQGIVALAEGILMAAKGEKIVAQASTGTRVSEPLDAEPVDLIFMYCTEFMLRGDGVDTEKFRRSISRLGDSVLVVGSDGVYRTHVHTNDPGKVLDRATKLGELSQIKINNMKEQSEARRQLLEQRSPGEQNTKEIGVLAVVSGEGLKQIMRSLGVSSIVNGGQTMNPAAADIAAQIDKSGSNSFIILPNNKNIVMTAEQAASITPKKTAVIPTHSVPEAFAAMLIFDPEKSLKVNQKTMSEAMATVKTGEVTHASRDSKVASKKVKKGELIGIFGGQIRATGSSLTNTCLNLISMMVDEDSEVMTLIIGEGVSNRVRITLTEKLIRKYPEIEIEIHDGGQPLYPVIIGIE